MQSVTQGLAGLTAYGIILLVNEKLSTDIRHRMESRQLFAALAFRDFLYLWGVLFLTGIIGHLIIESEIVPLKLHDVIIITITAIVLTGPIVTFHRPIFGLTFDLLEKDKLPANEKERFVNWAYGSWVFGFVGFIITANPIYLILWLVIPIGLIAGALRPKQSLFIRWLIVLLAFTSLIISIFT